MPVSTREGLSASIAFAELLVSARLPLGGVRVYAVHVRACSRSLLGCCCRPCRTGESSGAGIGAI